MSELISDTLKAAVNRGIFLLSVVVFISGRVQAVEQAAEQAAGDTSKTLPGPPVGAGELANITLGLLAVLALIFALAWLYRRYGNLPAFNRSDIQLLGGVSLGTREKAILLEVEGTRILVGVTSNQITPLHVFPAEDTASDEQQRPSSETSVNESSSQAFAKTLKMETRVHKEQA